MKRREQMRLDRNDISEFIKNCGDDLENLSHKAYGDPKSKIKGLEKDRRKADKLRSIATLIR